MVIPDHLHTDDLPQGRELSGDGEAEDLSIEKTELALIRRALDKYKGNRKLAAEELGISERTLYRKLKSLE